MKIHVLCLFLILDRFSVLEADPVFDNLDIDLVVTPGELAILPCSVEKLGKHTVTWSFNTPATLLTFGNQMFVNDPRFRVIQPTHKDWNLEIRDVTEGDSGQYLCSVNTIPVSRKLINLYVKGTKHRVTSAAGRDPCLIAEKIGDPKRTITNIPTEMDPLICDNDLNETSWYRFDSYTGGKMPERCVGINHCGTFGTIWLNGTHPTAKDKEPVVRSVCGEFRRGQCCGWRENIQVKRCEDADGEYFVYQLVRPPRCDIAYCVGAGLLCGKGLAYNSIKKMCANYSVITSNPVLGVPYVSKWEEVTTPRRTRINVTSLAIDCHIKYPLKVKDDGVRFDVVFQTDGGVELAKFKTDSSHLTVTLDGSYLEGHLGKTLACKVRSYLESNDPGLYKSRFYYSQKYWFGIQPDDTCGYRNNSNSGKPGSSVTITTTSRVGLERTIHFIGTDSKERLNYIKKELAKNEQQKNKAVKDKNKKMTQMEKLKRKLEADQAKIATLEEKIKKLNTCRT